MLIDRLTEYVVSPLCATIDHTTLAMRGFGGFRSHSKHDLD